MKNQLFNIITDKFGGNDQDLLSILEEIGSQMKYVEYNDCKDIFATNIPSFNLLTVHSQVTC